jgi:hypothetical protein
VQIETYELGRPAGGLESSTPVGRLPTRIASRALQSGTSGQQGTPTVTVVTTGEAFIGAVYAGAEHIELADHIILPIQNEPWGHLDLPTTLKSITVRRFPVLPLRCSRMRARSRQSETAAKVMPCHGLLQEAGPAI